MLLPPEALCFGQRQTLLNALSLLKRSVLFMHILIILLLSYYENQSTLYKGALPTLIPSEMGSTIHPVLRKRYEVTKAKYIAYFFLRWH